MDHLRLLCDLSEISALFVDSLSLESFLQKTVSMVARHIDADVCSIYVFDEESRELTLRATHGLNEESVGKVRLRLGEGLVGLTLEERVPIRERVGHQHPNFKPIPGIREEPFDSFLAVPIIRGILRIGVLVVQRKKERPFQPSDVMTLRAVASQLANAVENAKLLMSQHAVLDELNREQAPVEELRLKGQVASEGFAIGPATVLDREGRYDSLIRREFPDSFSLSDFRRSIEDTESQLEELQEKVEAKLSDVASLIFTTHLLILKDVAFTGEIEKLIESGVSAPKAVAAVANSFIGKFRESANQFVQEKVHDVKDLVIRVLENLYSERQPFEPATGRIVVANELYPSDLLALSIDGVAGMVLVTGGITSHFSILARSLMVPVLIVNDTRLLGTQNGTRLVLDAQSGNVYVNPDDTVCKDFTARQSNLRNLRSANRAVKPATVTRDGVRVRLLANINLLTDADLAREFNAEGIGLYRTEYPFIMRSNFPTEEEQFAIYSNLIERFPGRSITFRTLDIGGDKVLSYYVNAKEQNPFLGMRSIRFTLRNRDVFVQQIRAMLRAGFGCPLRIMFPMISSLEEFTEAKIIVLNCIRDLRAEGQPICEEPEIGMMAEVPSVLQIIDAFALEADFISIGTNDLIQYLLAVDRTNEKVADMYQPHHPSVLRTVGAIVAAANSNGIEVSVCGDMAHFVEYLPFLIGVGVRTLSVEPNYLSRIQSAIELIDTGSARRHADELLSCTRVEEITALLREQVPENEWSFAQLE